MRLAKALLGRRRRDVLGALEQTQPVLDLCEAELELLVLGAEDEAELPEDAVHARAGALGDARRVAAPASDRVLDGRTRLVALHSPALDERVDQILHPLRSQRDDADAREEQLL